MPCLRWRIVLDSCTFDGVLRLEFQAKLHGRVEECRDRVERNQQALRHAGEGQPDLEGVLTDVQVPELCWRTIVISSGCLSRRRCDNRTPGAVERKGDVEMMVAGQAIAAGLGQNLAHDALSASCTMRS